jgi:hypothetical protein
MKGEVARSCDFAWLKAAAPLDLRLALIGFKGALVMGLKDV